MYQLHVHIASNSLNKKKDTTSVYSVPFWKKPVSLKWFRSGRCSPQIISTRFRSANKEEPWTRWCSKVKPTTTTMFEQQTKVQWFEHQPHRSISIYIFSSSLIFDCPWHRNEMICDINRTCFGKKFTCREFELEKKIHSGGRKKSLLEQLSDWKRKLSKTDKENFKLRDIVSLSCWYENSRYNWITYWGKIHLWTPWGVRRVIFESKKQQGGLTKGPWLHKKTPTRSREKP